MTLTLELSAEIEQVLEARAQARGVSLPKYLQDLAARDARECQVLVEDEARRTRIAAAHSGYGKFAGLGGTVDELLQTRRAEARREMGTAEPRAEDQREAA